MKKTKFICLITALILVLSSLFMSSCSSKDPSHDLDKIKSSGVIKVGMECAYAPFNWTQTDESNGAVKISNADGYANGYDVQIAKQIADGLDVKLEIYVYEWEALIPSVESGTLDCIIAGMSPTAERKETIDFTSNYYISNLVIIMNKDSSYANASSLSDFAGAKIGAQSGTFHENAVTQIENVQPSILANFTLLYTALTSGTIDGYIAEEPTAFDRCSSNDSLTYAALVNNDTGFKCSEEDTAIAVGIRKNSSANDKISKIIDGISVEQRNELMMKMVELAPEK